MLLDGAARMLNAVSAKSPTTKRREADRDHREEGEERGAAEGGERLAEGVGHRSASSASAAAAAESKTSSPWLSSRTRYCGCARTRSRSWVAMSTVIPEALISRKRSKTPRVAHSSRFPVGSSARRMQRVVGEGAGDRHPLPLAAGELVAGGDSALAASPTCASRRLRPRARSSARVAPVTSSAKATFSSAVRSGRRRKSWKTTPSAPAELRDVAAAQARRGEAGDPHLPRRGRLRHLESCRMVDLPAPEWPVRKANSPFRMWKETSRSAAPERGYSL